MAEVALGSGRGEVTQLLLQAFHGLGRYTHPDRSVPLEEAKAQKLALPGSRHRTLLLVHFQLELLFQKLPDTVQHSLARPRALHVYIAVLRVPHEPVTPTPQLP